ncbi:hypothetical protein JCM33374_g909 [Metschnikowia sp. JCM 33374]|nr:hypothetical protein JCM33374_g909 [Metschnikowia sp. JCM 33374]
MNSRFKRGKNLGKYPRCKAKQSWVRPIMHPSTLPQELPNTPSRIIQHSLRAPPESHIEASSPSHLNYPRPFIPLKY